jgi:hypothetical protein
MSILAHQLLPEMIMKHWHEFFCYGDDLPEDDTIFNSYLKSFSTRSTIRKKLGVLAPPATVP